MFFYYEIACLVEGPIPFAIFSKDEKKIKNSFYCHFTKIQTNYRERNLVSLAKVVVFANTHIIDYYVKMNACDKYLFVLETELVAVISCNIQTAKSSEDLIVS